MGKLHTLKREILRQREYIGNIRLSAYKEEDGKWKFYYRVNNKKPYKKFVENVLQSNSNGGS